MSRDEDPKAAIADLMAMADGRDWSEDHHDAWLWGIVHGWDESEIDAVTSKHGWSADDVAHLRLLHDRWQHLS
jgi:hypothetical protein